jgi:hypothetical protein
MVNYSLMKLSERVLEELARMVVGNAKHFPYRSSHFITRFFARCRLPFVHDGTTRPKWAQERLAELNLGAAQSTDLPSDDLCRVISELFDPDDFERHNDKVANHARSFSVTLNPESVRPVVDSHLEVQIRFLAGIGYIGASSHGAHLAMSR